MTEQTQKSHVAWIETVSERWVLCAAEHAEAEIKSDGKYYFPRRQRIRIAAPAVGSEYSAFAAEREQHGGESALMDAYFGGAVINAGQDAQSDLAGGGKVTPAKVNEYIVLRQFDLADEGLLTRGCDMAKVKAIVAARLADGKSNTDAKSTATREDMTVLKKLAREYFAARKAEAVARAAARIGTTG